MDVVSLPALVFAAVAGVASVIAARAAVQTVSLTKTIRREDHGAHAAFSLQIQTFDGYDEDECCQAPASLLTDP